MWSSSIPPDDSAIDEELIEERSNRGSVELATQLSSSFYLVIRLHDGPRIVPYRARPKHFN
jgi:hypothetical protein